MVGRWVKNDQKMLDVINGRSQTVFLISTMFFLFPSLSKFYLDFIWIKFVHIWTDLKQVETGYKTCCKQKITHQLPCCISLTVNTLFEIRSFSLKFNFKEELFPLWLSFRGIFGSKRRIKFGVRKQLHRACQIWYTRYNKYHTYFIYYSLCSTTVCCFLGTN